MTISRDQVESRVKKHNIDVGVKILNFGKSMSSKDLRFICNCGKEETQSSDYFIAGKAGCKECRRKLMMRNQSLAKLGKTAHNKKTQDQYIKDLAKANPNMVCLGQYTSSSSPLLHRCKICKSERTYLPLNILRLGCRDCAGTAFKTTDAYNEELAIKGIAFKTEEYEGAKVPIYHTCSKCNKFSIRASPTNMLKLGKIKCVECDGSSVYVVKVKNRIFRVRGYERFAVRPLVARFGLKNVLVDLDGDIPRIDMKSGAKHKPDFFIPNENLMVEVKSIPTMGLSNFKVFGRDPVKVFKGLKNKKKAALKMGYRYFVLLISGSGEQLKIPQDWETMSRSALQKFILKDLGHPLK